MPNEAVVEKDPWLDDEFANVDFSRHREDLMDDLAEIERQDPAQFPVTLQPETVTNVPEPEPVAQTEPEPEPEPEVIELDGGGTLTIEKKGKKWCASLDAGVGGTQNFYGANKNELLVAAFKAQANATRKIRDLNREKKLGTTETPKPQTAPTVGRALTADEIVSIKLKLETNPDLAFQEWFQTTTGMNVQELVRLAKSGGEAKQELTAEQVNKEFLSRCPEFYPDAGYENFASLVTYLAKHKLGRSVSADNQEAVYQALLSGGHWTVQNLDTAFHDLNDDGLLIAKPKTRPATTPAAAAPTPAPAPRTDERIVQTQTRPRASLGIRTSETAQVAPPPTPVLPSADDYDEMTPEQLLTEIRKAKLAARPSGRR